MFGRVKLRGRILLGYAVPIPLFIILAVLVYVNTNNMGQLIQSFNASREGQEITGSMEADISDMERATRGYLLTKKQDHINAFKERYENFIAHTRNANKLVKESKKEYFNDEQRKQVEAINSDGEQVKKIDARLLAKAQAGKMPEAIKLFSNEESVRLVRQATKSKNDFNEIALKQIHDEEQSINSSLKVLNGVAGLGTFAAIVACIGIGSWIAYRISQDIKQAIHVISTSSTEIAATVEQQERTAQHQATSVHQTSTTMDELNASSRQAAEQAESATTRARAIAEQVFRLSEQTKQISKITNLVGDLANQTNMLALNAAVEAVRAGEQGKGFGVVASEIRKLADQSKKSAERINGLIADIQALTDASVIDTGDGSRVESIVAAVNNIVLNNQHISLTAKQQALAVEQVVAVMNSLNQGASETASGISQTKIGIQRLNSAAQNLQAIV